MSNVAKLNTPPPSVETTAPHVLTAINAVMEEVSREGISKSRNNAQQGYKFRGIDDVYNALAPILARNKLVITPSCITRQKEVVTTAKGGTLFYVTVDMNFELASALDGSTKTARMFGEAMDSGDKATNKAMSAAYKYMAMQEFCIPTEGDNDADAVTHEVAQTAREPKAETQGRVRQSLVVTTALTAITSCETQEELTAWLDKNEPSFPALEKADLAVIEKAYGIRFNALDPFRPGADGGVPGRDDSRSDPRAEDVIDPSEIPY